MRILLATLASILAALIVQPVVLFVWAFLPALFLPAGLPWNELPIMGLLVIAYASPFVILLGVPLTLMLHRFGKFSWWPLALAGTFAGGLFIGWSGPGSVKGFSSGGSWYGGYREFIVDGQPTAYGWLNYLQSVAGFSLHGLIGATVFYLVWSRWMAKEPAHQPIKLSALGQPKSH